jgi:hypothetical protein
MPASQINRAAGTAMVVLSLVALLLVVIVAQPPSRHRPLAGTLATSFRSPSPP